MASRRLTLDFFSSLGKKPRAVSFPSSLSPPDSAIARTPSFNGPSSVPETLQSFHADLDQLIGENEMNSLDDVNKKAARDLLRIRRSHWKDASNVYECMRCKKAFGFAMKKHNCRR